MHVNQDVDQFSNHTFRAAIAGHVVTVRRKFEIFFHPAVTRPGAWVCGNSLDRLIVALLRLRGVVRPVAAWPATAAPEGSYCLWSSIWARVARRGLHSFLHHFCAARIAASRVAFSIIHHYKIEYVRYVLALGTAKVHRRHQFSMDSKHAYCSLLQ